MTNPSQAAAFYGTAGRNLNDTTWNQESEIGKAFKKASEYLSESVYKNNPDRINLAYEMAMAAVLTKFNSGVTLHKKDASRKFKFQ